MFYFMKEKIKEKKIIQNFQKQIKISKKKKVRY